MEPLKQISPAVTETSGEEERGIAEIVAIVGAIKATKKGSTIGHFSHRNDETSKTR